MVEPKKDLFELISQVSNVNVYQTRPEIIDTTMNKVTITYYVSGNQPMYSISKELLLQDVQVVVDIWGKNSTLTSAKLIELEAIMIDNDYRLVFNADVPDDETYSHLNLRFETVL